MEEINMPKHIAIIMDGNRRWARSKNLPIKLGHKQGAETLKKIVKRANELGIKYLTVYAFSTENWKRSKEEVDGLMSLLESYLNQFNEQANTESIVIKVLGDLTPLSKSLQDSIHNVVESTKNNTGIVFNIALNYGGRDEIVKAVRNIAKEVKNGDLDLDSINEETISKHLYTKNVPDPDLLIRTSGEIRLSGFLPWQSVYSEFLFIDKLWPDFSEEDLENAIEIYSHRNRKFGAK